MLNVDRHGWTVTSPNQPSASCRWCGRPHSIVQPRRIVEHNRAVVICVVCDGVGAWPLRDDHG